MELSTDISRSKRRYFAGPVAKLAINKIVIVNIKIIRIETDGDKINKYSEFQYYRRYVFSKLVDVIKKPHMNCPTTTELFIFLLQINVC